MTDAGRQRRIIGPFDPPNVIRSFVVMRVVRSRAALQEW